MRGLSRPKDGVLSHAYDPRIHEERQQANQYCYPDGAASWIAGSSPAMTVGGVVPLHSVIRRIKPGDDK
jgi:hypothetical protein